MSGKYLEAVGRRKEAVARVRVMPSEKDGFVVNDRKLEEYFPVARLQKIAQESFAKGFGKGAVSVKVSGGGQTAQAEAVRLGVARALVKGDEEKRPELKRAGFLKRDSRVVERKKFGLKKARRAPQWSKR